MNCDTRYRSMDHHIGLHNCHCGYFPFHQGEPLSKKMKIKLLKKHSVRLKEKIEDIEELIKELEGK